MSRLAVHLALTVGVLTAATHAASGADLEVVVHEGSSDGAGVPNLDLLLCKGGPCTAVATTDAKGRAVFEGVDAGDVFVRAMTVGCGPFEWPVTVGSAAPQKADVVVPATGRLNVRVQRLEQEGKTIPVAGKRVEFLITTQTELPAFPRLSATTTETDDKGFAHLCLPAGVELEVEVRAQGFQAGKLPRQQLKPGESASAQMTLRTE